jgi:hypothetical protein
MAITRGAGFTGAKSVASDTENLGAPKLALAQIDFGTAVNGKLGDDGAFATAINAVSERCTIFSIGPLAGTNQKVTYIYEDIGQTNTEMQTALQACATVDGVNLGAATVTLKALDSDLS